MASPNSRPKEVDVTKKPDIEVTRPAEVNPTKVKPEMETKVKPDIDAAAASASAVPKVKAQEPDLPKAGQPEVTPDAGKKVQKPEEVDTEATKAGKVEEEDTNWGPDEISRLREDWGVQETDTLAVAKTDIEGLEDIVFKGGSPRVRKEAGLDDLDVLKPDRAIKSSGKIASATRHAEADVANEFVEAVEKAGLSNEEVKGVLHLYQSNPSGVCPTCLSGLGNPDKASGVIKQLSERYPNLKIKVSSNQVEGVRVTGRSNFTVQNGKYVD